MTSAAADILSRRAALPDAVLRYAAHQDGLVDLHLPDGPGPHPLAVLLHGGFWRQDYDRLHQRPLARALVAEGCVVAAPEYRRVGGAGGWPRTADDVRQAFATLPGLLASLGIATSSTTVVGHSAGGHLALWLASLDRGAEPGRVDRVVGLAPVGDLTAAARERLGAGATQALLGGEPEAVPERYAAADPMRLLSHTDPATALVVLHGADDPVVPIGNSRGLAAAHPRVRLEELDCGHYEVIDPLSLVWPAVRAAVLGGRDD